MSSSNNASKPYLPECTEIEPGVRSVGWSQNNGNSRNSQVIWTLSTNGFFLPSVMLEGLEGGIQNIFTLKFFSEKFKHFLMSREKNQVNSFRFETCIQFLIFFSLKKTPKCPQMGFFFAFRVKVPNLTKIKEKTRKFQLRQLFQRVPPIQWLSNKSKDT